LARLARTRDTSYKLPSQATRCGEVPEWPIGLVSKTSERATVP
jgi:hypothetical protein